MNFIVPFMLQFDNEKQILPVPFLLVMGDRTYSNTVVADIPKRKMQTSVKQCNEQIDDVILDSFDSSLATTSESVLLMLLSVTVSSLEFKQESLCLVEA